MNEQELNKELRRLAKEIAEGGTLTVNLFELAKSLNKEIQKNG